MNMLKKGITILISGLILVSVSGCGEKEPEKTTSAGTNVTVEKVSVQSIEENVTYTGELKASLATSVSAKVSGNVQTTFCEVGDYVNEGDILLQIDRTDYQLQYDQAYASYRSVVSQSGTLIATAQIEYNNAKTNLDNQRVLYDNGAISKIAYDSAETRFINAEINLNSAKEQSGVTTAEAALNAAENSLGYTTIYAPVSGYVATKNASIGQMISPGIEIFSIKNTETVDAQINVNESVISKISVGSKAIVSVESVGETIEATVTTASPTKNPQTGMYNVTVTIENEEGILKDGMFADITLTLSDSVDAMVVPSNAVFEDVDGKKYVYIVNGDTADKTEVTVGIITDEYTEILSGVEEEDTVVVSGKEYLSDNNNKIKVVE